MNNGRIVDPDLVQMMDAVFLEHGQDPGLWQRLDALGLVRLTGAPERGGSGAGWHEAAELLSAAARHAVRIPLAEHDLLACWLLDAVETPADGEVRTVCMLNKQGYATEVPWVATADRVVVVWRADGQYRAADVAADRLTITAGTNLIGEPRDEVAADLADLQGVPITLALVTELRLRSGLVRSIQVCAALDRVLQLCVEHVSTRIQFGRPLSKFQAVQNLIADVAAEAALARAATEAALSAAVANGWSAPELNFLVAVSRSCAGHATSVAVRNAHQVHGAIGTTREHRLPEFTRAALAWRSEFGSMRYWDDQVTDAAMHASAGGLWAMMT